ncbi:MAG TPA: KTSC domain-containing protein [Dehalococcoidia bacterium]|nr:KTSC domain-containing protein [Dehalococcoidia bacterium]
MRRQPVTSESLKSVGFQPAGGVLEVEFNNGHVYRYLRVPRRVYQGLLRAPSLGVYFNECIKSDYTYTPVPAPAYAGQEG